MSGTDILFLAHRLPYPPDRGDRIRSWQIVQALAKLRPVHVIAPLDDRTGRRHVAAVEAIAASVSTAVRSRSKGWAVARALMTGEPASVALFAVPALQLATRRLLASGRIGTVFAFSGQMARYVPTGIATRFVMDFVDMDSAKFAQQAVLARGLPALALRTEARRLLAFEVATATRADASLFVSRAEADLFTQRTGLLADVVENGVDTEYFAPDATLPAVPVSNPLIVFTGQMDYAPNVAAVAAFVRDVLPDLAGATFAIVGRAPTPAVRALTAANVVVTGEVDDVRPWLAAADTVVAPLSIARGVQNKVLEAMAMARPVVASPAAAAGIDAVDGRDLIIADARAQATVLTRLLADPARARQIGAAARARVVARYGWDACLTPLAQLVA